MVTIGIIYQNEIEDKGSISAITFPQEKNQATAIAAAGQSTSDVRKVESLEAEKKKDCKYEKSIYLCHRF